MYVRADNRQALHSSFTHRCEIARSPVRDLSGCYRKVREVRQASDIEQVLRLQAPQNSEHGANTRQFHVLFEFVKPQSRLDAGLNRRVRLIQSPSHKCGRKLGEIALHWG